MSWRLLQKTEVEVVPPDLAVHGLSPRLAAVAEMVPKHSAVVDVGTDHALLPIALVGSGRCVSAIGIDVSEGAIAGARANRLRHGVQVELRVADGPDVDPGEASVLVMAGLGGSTICGLLRAGFERVIVQPNTDAEDVRRRLAELGYVVERERLVADGDRFYVVISSVAATPHALGLEAAFVGQLRDDPLFEMWAALQREHMSKKPQADPRLQLIGGNDTIGGR